MAQTSPPTGSFTLPAPAPFRLDLTAWALKRRSQNPTDHWDGHTYRRVLLIGGHSVAVAVREAPASTPAAPLLDVTVSGEPLAASAQARLEATVQRLLGLQVDLSAFYARAARDPVLGSLATRYRGLKPPRFPSLFECLLNAVACQQVSLASGLSVLGRLAQLTGASVDGLYAFPDPARVLKLDVAELRAIGFSVRKAQTTLELAAMAVSGELDVSRFEALDDQEAERILTGVRGIGRWSANYALLRGLGRLHLFPPTDVGALNGLRSLLDDAAPELEPDEALARWHQDAGLVYFHLLLRGIDAAGALNASTASP